MAIKYCESEKAFRLDTSNSTYIFKVGEFGHLLSVYYGKLLAADFLPAAPVPAESHCSFEPTEQNCGDPSFSNTINLMEYPSSGSGDYRIPAITIRSHEGNTVTDLRYAGYSINKGKPSIPGLPSLYVSSEDEADTLEIYMEDNVTGVKATLYYSVFKDYPAITRWVRLENSSDEEFNIKKIASTCASFAAMDYRVIHLPGVYAHERQIESFPLHKGLQAFSSSRGASGHYENPFVALAKEGSEEEKGEVYGFNLVYSGSFSTEIQGDGYDTVRLLMGINCSDFSWLMEPGEVFYTPEAVMVFSDKGLGGMSRAFHRLYNNCLIRGKWKNEKRPLLINSWEAAYWNISEEKLLGFAQHAAELGIEMLVMDDGWFGHRDDDTSSLGDWTVNREKLPHGLPSFIQKVNSLGLKFGIWFEPEMVSQDSSLYKSHPDWCLHVPGREPKNCRHQLVLDMTRQDVRDNIFNQMYKILSENKIDYVKWDFNRNLTEAGSALLPAERGEEIYHRFVLGIYELLDRITKAFPDILLETCSGGGGRFDPGMLFYSPQIWASDNTDPMDRLSIQFGTSLCYPASSMGAHVSASKRTGIETRRNVALWGTFGYELDPTILREDEREIIKKQVQDYHYTYRLIHDGDLYRLKYPDDESGIAAWMFVSKDENSARITCVATKDIPKDETNKVMLHGLKENVKYRIIETGEILTGKEIALTPNPMSEGESKVYTLEIM